ncbi:MAG TPA: glycerate kinase, partial [Solirubrobacterales bacterium]|nr:glycerate kinase [Solirubrobacterales bacterium]
LVAADAVITGEGRFDSQSLAGKITGEIVNRCARAGKPLHLVVGQDGLGGAAHTDLASVAEAGSLAEMERKAFELAGGR